MVPALQGAVALASDGGLESTKLMNKKRTAATPWGSKISDTSDISLAFGFGNHRLRHNGWKFVWNREHDQNNGQKSGRSQIFVFQRSGVPKKIDHNHFVQYAGARAQGAVWNQTKWHQFELTQNFSQIFLDAKMGYIPKTFLGGCRKICPVGNHAVSEW